MRLMSSPPTPSKTRGRLQLFGKLLELCVEGLVARGQHVFRVQRPQGFAPLRGAHEKERGNGLFLRERGHSETGSGATRGDNHSRVAFSGNLLKECVGRDDVDEGSGVILRGDVVGKNDAACGWHHS